MRAAVLLAITASLGLTLQAQPTFRAGVDLVTFGVTVTDRKGNLVTDLTRDDFEILEDGKPQAIKLFLRGDEEGENAALHLGLMLDTSGSMEADLKLARSAAIKFLNLLPEAEDITLVDFDTEVRVTRYPQRDFPRLVERIRLRKPDGWTALYDALAVYLDGVHQLSGRRILVLYTDGSDTRSSINFGDLLDNLRASPVTVYGVGLTEHLGSYRTTARMRLQQIAEATGGQVFYPTDLKDLDKSYAKVLEEIKAQYHLGYASTNTVTDGKWRKVEFKLKRPNLKIRSRQGYFAPFKQSQ